MKWGFFVGAAILAVYFLLTNGAPPLPVAIGVALAAAFTFWKSRRPA